MNAVEEQIKNILFFQSEPMSSNMLAPWQIEQATEALNALINQKEKESEIRALESLLDGDAEEVTCVCESASTAVCDHNWSLCNVVRGRIKQLKEELKEEVL